MIVTYKKDKTELCKLIIEILISKLSEKVINIAISGGSTPKILFSMMASKEYRNHINWDNLNIYWVDERCVEPTDDDSNYKMTFDTLISRVPISKENIFRIKGEEEPQEEIRRYNKLVLSNLTSENGFPIFDIVMLGIGDDGHTSSIFPTEMDILLDSPLPYEVATNPYSGQTRIALTGKAIISAKEIIFLVTGENKRRIIQNIIDKTEEAKNYPSNFVVSNREDCKLFTDIKIN